MGICVCAHISATVRVSKCSLSTRGSEVGTCTRFGSCRVINRCRSTNGSNGSVRKHIRFGHVVRSVGSNGSNISCILIFGLSHFNEGTTSILSALRIVRSFNIGLVYIRSKVSSSGSTKGLVVSILSTITRVRHRGVHIRAVRNEVRGTHRKG